MAATKFEKRETVAHRIVHDVAMASVDIRKVSYSILSLESISQKDAISFLAEFIRSVYERILVSSLGDTFNRRFTLAALELVDFEVIAKEVLEDCDEQ